MGNSVPSRRGFLKLGLGAAVAAATPLGFWSESAMAAAFNGVTRRLNLVSINTRESFNGVYWENGNYRPDALRRIDVVLRDHKAEQVGRIDRRLLDVLWVLHQRADSQEPFEVICGFRGRRTNANLRRRSRGVAKESYHTRGMAVDVSLPDRDLRGLCEEALRLGAGGVGYYPRSGFVHVDVGPVRTWGARVIPVSRRQGGMPDLDGPHPFDEDDLID